MNQMPPLSLSDALCLMQQRFGQDCVITLATVFNNQPYAREIDACYINGSFYFLTCAESRKIQHIRSNPQVGIAGRWMEATGTARILGDFRDPANQDLIRMLCAQFPWFDLQTEQYPTPYSFIVRVDLDDAEVINQDHLSRLHFERENGVLVEIITPDPAAA